MGLIAFIEPALPIITVLLKAICPGSKASGDYEVTGSELIY